MDAPPNTISSRQEENCIFKMKMTRKHKNILVSETFVFLSILLRLYHQECSVGYCTNPCINQV